MPLKMEGGRSVIHEDNIYCAAYDSDQIHCYSVGNKSWTDYGKQMYYTNPGLAIINECVAAIGGQKNDSPTNEVWVWMDQNWVKYASMKYKRSDPAVVSYKNYVITISGNSHIKVVLPWMACVEVYDVNIHEWKEVCSLPSPFPRVEVTLCQNMVYVFPDHYKEAMTCDPNDLVQPCKGQDIWKFITNFPLRYSTPATLDNNIVCVGGAGKTKDGKKDIYEYNAEEDLWEKVGQLQVEGRMYAMVEVCDNKCVVVGGIRALTDDRRPSQRFKTGCIFTTKSLLPTKKNKKV